MRTGGSGPVRGGSLAFPNGGRGGGRGGAADGFAGGGRGGLGARPLAAAAPQMATARRAAEAAPRITPTIVAFARSAKPAQEGEIRRHGGKMYKAVVAVSEDGKHSIMVWVCVDSGATQTIVKDSWISQGRIYMTRDNPCAVAWGDSGTSIVTVKGQMVFWLDDLRFTMEAWGCPDVTTTALLSARQLAEAGAAVHLAADGNNIDLTGVGVARRVPIGEEAMVSIRVEIFSGQDGQARSVADATAAAAEAAARAAPYVAAAAAAASAADAAVAQARSSPRSRQGN
jgi:hypothetical protein